MNLVKHYMTSNRCYTRKNKITVKKLVLHSLGCAQPSVDAFINQWDNQVSTKCVHAFIETDRIVQTLPWSYKGWHVGSGSKGSYNSCAIGVEICEPKGHTYGSGSTMIGYDATAQKTYFNKVYNNAVELFAYLCKEHNLTSDDILCHSEVYQLGYGSNHGDVMHWFPKHGKSMDTFRADAKAKLEESDMPSTTITPESSKSDIKWLQMKLNEVLPDIPEITPLSIDGDYGPITRIAVLYYWSILGWGNHLKDDGTRIGKSTREALNIGRTV